MYGKLLVRKRNCGFLTFHIHRRKTTKEKIIFVKSICRNPFLNAKDFVQKLKQVKTHFFRKREIEIKPKINITYFGEEKRRVQLNAFD